MKPISDKELQISMCGGGIPKPVWVCSHCGKVVHEDDHICVHCGEKVYEKIRPKFD